MFNFTNLKDRRYFDEKDIPTDVWSVLRTASLLSVGEFRVFEIAYEEWFGETGDEDTIEGYFVPYMFKEVVPPWVRHFCQRIRRLDEEGALDLRKLGIEKVRASSEQKWRGVEAFFWIFATLLILIVLAEMAERIPELSCRFPPCG